MARSKSEQRLSRSGLLLWVETQIDILKAYEAVDHQAGAINSSRASATSETTSALRPRPRDPPPDRPPASFNDSLRSGRELWRAGMSPKRRMVNRESAHVK